MAREYFDRVIRDDEELRNRLAGCRALDPGPLEFAPQRPIARRLAIRYRTPKLNGISGMEGETYSVHKGGVNHGTRERD